MNYACSFRQFLTSRGYKDAYLENTVIKSRQLIFSGILVKDVPGEDGKIIQAFALMSDSDRRRHRLYPFYRTHTWKNNGNLYPSCSVASMDDYGNWTVFNAHDTTQERTPDYVDFDNAVARFKKRMDVAPARKLNERAKFTCWILAALFTGYVIVGMIWPELGLPLNGDFIAMCILIVVLILLPTLLPLIKSISFFGIDLIIGKE